MAGLLESIWPYIPPGFRQSLFGGNDYAQAQPSPGLLNTRPSAPPRYGLLSALAETTPGADIRDAVNYSGAATRALGSGNIPQALLDTAYIPAALAGVVLPGSASSYRQAGGAVSDALTAPRVMRDSLWDGDLYHGTASDYDFPSTQYAGGVAGSKGEAAYYLTPDPDAATEYALTAAATRTGHDTALEGANLRRFQIAPANPLVVTAETHPGLSARLDDGREVLTYNSRAFSIIIRNAQRDGHDVVIFRNIKGDGSRGVADQYAVIDTSILTPKAGDVNRTAKRQK